MAHSAVVGDHGIVGLVASPWVGDAGGGVVLGGSGTSVGCAVPPRVSVALLDKRASAGVRVACWARAFLLAFCSSTLQRTSFRFLHILDTSKEVVVTSQRQRQCS